ncbi:hypothetical protein GCM10009716_31370 [Streptomyces sodiiphilus]|uniref:Putative restriction endonuclease domain-containing protein n=1 Tax=Streptomyces sodiiphilus TaxID=226217 RepID=A0ABP5AQZ3_9ACTN
MTADPVTEPMAQDPVDLLIAFEEAADTPIRPEFIEGMVVVAPQPGNLHNHGASELYFQLRSAGFRHAGFGNGYRIGLKDERTRTLVVPDFYVQLRTPTEVDEAYRRVHKGWYPIELLALAGEITSTNHEIDSGPKYRSYAGAGVPVYVLIHRAEGVACAFSDPVPEGGPSGAHYATRTEVELGRPLPLPAPYPALDTSVCTGADG